MRNNSKTYNKASLGLVVLVDADDARRLNSFFRHELGYYNNLIAIFESRVRGFPAQIRDITDQQIKLFCDLAYHNINLRKVLNSQEWPKELKHHTSTVFDREGKCLLKESEIMIMEGAFRDRLVVIPETKKQMARAVIEWFRHQAEILSAPQLNEKYDMIYRAPPVNLSQLEFQLKRHAQVPKNQVKWNYNHDLDQTELLTPLNAKPIVIPGFNLNEFNRWTNLIIKQDDGKFVDDHTPWVVEFKNTGNRYLLKYLDIGNKNHTKFTK